MRNPLMPRGQPPPTVSYRSSLPYHTWQVAQHRCIWHLIRCATVQRQQHTPTRQFPFAEPLLRRLLLAGSRLGAPARSAGGAVRTTFQSPAPTVRTQKPGDRARARPDRDSSRWSTNPAGRPALDCVAADGPVRERVRGLQHQWQRCRIRQLLSTQFRADRGDAPGSNAGAGEVCDRPRRLVQPGRGERLSTTVTWQVGSGNVEISIGGDLDGDLRRWPRGSSTWET